MLVPQDMGQPAHITDRCFFCWAFGDLYGVTSPAGTAFRSDLGNLVTPQKGYLQGEGWIRGTASFMTWRVLYLSGLVGHEGWGEEPSGHVCTYCYLSTDIYR